MDVRKEENPKKKIRRLWLMLAAGCRNWFSEWVTCLRVPVRKSLKELLMDQGG